MADAVTGYKWKFFRAGGFDQVQLDAGAAIANLEALDPKLWVALACPTTGVEFDTKTLALIDTDKDGRIRHGEMIAACKWACACLKSPDALLKGSSTLPLNAVNDATPEGQQILSSAKQILAILDKSSATEISLDDWNSSGGKLTLAPFNGDGIVPADSADDPAVKALITDILNCCIGDIDRSAKPGVSQAKLDLFYADAAAYSEWLKKSETDAAIHPLGDATPGASAAIKAVKIKVDDYFARCRLAAFDPRAVPALNREEKDFLVFAAKDLTLAHADIAALPLAQIAAGKPLPLTEGVNPAWAAAMATVSTTAITPLIGEKSALTEADWSALQAKLAAFDAWTAAKAGVSVEKLGAVRVREILAGTGKDAIAALIAHDKSLEAEYNNIATVEKLIRYHRDLFKLLNNFVAFRDFYGRKDKAIFQVGTLFLDQRSCDLCLAVEDAGRHATLAALAGCYMAYCDCVRKASNEKRQIVAAFTNGDSDNLMVGRNGIFVDRKGQEWDATITKILDNPISIRQAFWSPYKKFIRMVEEQFAKRAAAGEAANDKLLAETATTTANVDQSHVAPPKKLDIGVVAAIGVAVGAIGTALSGLATGLMTLAPWKIPLVFVGLILLISGPSMIIAWLKLRKRNLGPILDANGWAVNAKALISVAFGASLTQVATLPPGSSRSLHDPYADKKSAWPKLLAIVVVLWIIYAALDKLGFIYDWTNGRLGQAKPAIVQPIDPGKAIVITVPATTDKK